MPTTWTILTPTGTPGAIGVVMLSAPRREEVDAALARLGAETPVGSARLSDLLSIDRGLVVRWSETVVSLMPHGGPGVMRGIVRGLLNAGIEERREPEVCALYPEAASEVEARMLYALSRAASPLAIDLLLDQPRRWAERFDSNAELDNVLDRLIEPPLVVALGAANIGKSTLVNALAGRSVSIVADEPGTTRDHVGVMLDLGGLVVRYLDTPGMRPTENAIEAEAQELAREAAAKADLVLLMGDAQTPAPETDHANTVRVALRLDRGPSCWPHVFATSATTGVGLPALADGIRERLVPHGALADPRPWKFW